MHQPRKITLFCWILDISDRSFPVDIEGDLTVSLVSDLSVTASASILKIQQPHLVGCILLILIHDSLAVLIQLPFFFRSLLVHTPVYVMGSLGAKLAESEEETQAQNKVALLVSLLLIYSATFFCVVDAVVHEPRGGYGRRDSLSVSCGIARTAVTQLLNSTFKSYSGT